MMRVTLLAISLILSSCTIQDRFPQQTASTDLNHTGPTSSFSPPPVIDPPAPTSDGKLLALSGIHTSRSVLFDLASKTGVSDFRANADIMTTYGRIKTALNGSGNIFTFSGSMSGAYGELVARFCRAAEAKERALPANSPQRVLFRDLNLGGTPVTVRMMGETLAQQIALRFWSESLAPDQVTIVIRMLADLPASNDAMGARNLAIAACVAIGSAFPAFKI